MAATSAGNGLVGGSDMRPCHVDEEVEKPPSMEARPAEVPTMRVAARNMCGEEVVVEIQEDALVQDLAALIAATAGSDAAVKIIFGHDAPSPSALLSDAGIEADVTVTYVNVMRERVWQTHPDKAVAGMTVEVSGSCHSGPVPQRVLKGIGPAAVEVKRSFEVAAARQYCEENDLAGFVICEEKEDRKGHPSTRGCTTTFFGDTPDMLLGAASYAPQWRQRTGFRAITTGRYTLHVYL